MPRRPILKEFALQPAAFESAQDVREVMGKFSFAEGRLICEVPDDWKRKAQWALDRLPPVEAKSAKVHLKKLIDHGLVPARSNFRYDDPVRWADHVNRLVKQDELDGGIVKRGGDARLTDFDRFFADCPSGREGTICTTAQDYVALCRRLIEMGPRVVLVDPYFLLVEPDDFGYMTKRSGRDVLLRELLQIGLDGKCKDFEVVSSNNKNWLNVGPKLFDQSIKDAFSSIVDLDLNVVFTVVRSRRSWLRPHERYLITERGAIDIRLGFELRSESRVTPVSMVDGVLHKELCNKWYDGDRGFEKHGFEIAHKVQWSQGSIRVLVDAREKADVRPR